MSQYFDNRLRMAFEFIPASILAATAGMLLHDSAWVFPMMPGVARIFGWAFAGLGLLRTWQGLVILQYRAGLRRLPRYVLDAEWIPVSDRRLFLGRGFAWDQRHSQRLIETQVPAAKRWLQPNPLFRAARRFEMRFEKTSWAQPLIRLTSADCGWNPAR